MNFLFSNPYRAFFILWAAACIIVLPLMSRQAGITEDELQHMEHGKTILAWYEGKSDTAKMSPFNDAGVWKADPSVEGVGSKTAINIYGGLFDSFSALVYQTVTHHFFDEYESKHIMSALFGAMLFIIIGLICQRITGSWAVAMLGIIIATFTPRLFGNSLSNPKDIPQATMFAFSLLQIISLLKELPNASIKRWVLLGVSFSLTLAIRIPTVVLIFYFVAVSTVYLGTLFALGDIAYEKAVTTFGKVVLVSVLGYLGCSLFWPWALQNPLFNPIHALQVFKNFNSFDCYEVFEGHWLHQNELPWYFVPKWLYITLPVTVVLGVILFFVQLQRFLQKGGLNLLIYLLLIGSTLVPLLVIIIEKSNIYNSCRHVMFVIPAIIVIATLGWSELFRQVKNLTQRRMVYVAFICLLAEPMCFIMENNPVQALYFSPLIGGEKGAFKNYEMDYWGYSLRPAIEWLDHTDSIQVPGRKLRVRMYYGEQLKLSYYVEKSKNLAYALCMENSTDWDYMLMLPCEAKRDAMILYQWPPAGTVYEVKADGVPLCAVVKNTRTAPPSAPGSAPLITPGVPVDSVGYNLGLGIEAYNQKNYNMAIVYFKKALAFKPDNTLALNNLVATYNNLKMFEDAIYYGKKGMALNPNYDLLKNNLAASLNAIKTQVPSEGYYQELSYNYFVQGEYLKTIESGKKALAINPNSAAAWNNICSAYNALHQYQKALDACNKGLQIDAKSDLLKNNRAEAARQLGQK